MMQNPQQADFYRQRKYPRPTDVRGDFFRDQTAIIHSMPYRRLKHKTQVFFSPDNDHVCTRIEHVQHFATIAAAICKGLNQKGWSLDLEMAYAIGLGHDLGHAPFGHAGEAALSDCLKRKFIHEVNSYRVAQKLANNGDGLNLTYGVADGIISHNGESFEQSLAPSPAPKDLDQITDRTLLPTSIEGCIVRFSDKVAYLGRDIEDALMAKLIKNNDIPANVRTALGKKNGEIINTLVLDIINSSGDADCIRFSDSRYQLVNELKDFNYERIYGHKILATYIKYAKRIIHALFDYLGDIYSKHGNNYDSYVEEETALAKNFGAYLKKMQQFYEKETLEKPGAVLMDYIAGMTDDYALTCMREISMPKPILF
jgi:dGTPase